MDNIKETIDFEVIFKLNDHFKILLQNDYNLVYFEKRVGQISDKMEEKEDDNQFLHLFEIQQKEDSIFSKISSIDDLKEVKEKLIQFYTQFIDNFESYFDRIEDKLDEKNIESFDIIGKTLKNRKKKLDSSIKKFKTEDSWNIAKIREELQCSLQKNLKDIIDSLIRPISTGLHESSAYEEILKQLNSFLSKLGIYTYKFDAGQKLIEDDWDFIEPQEGDNCDTSNSDLKNVIKEIITYPYIIGDKQVISEGKIILWRVV